jgi:phage major capsid protein, HK97 family
MKKSTEIKQQMATVRKDLEGLQAAETWDKAEMKAKELMDLSREYQVQAALEQADFKNFTPEATSVSANLVQNKSAVNRIFNKLVLGRGALSDEEKQIMNAAGSPGMVESNDGKGGYLVPTEQFQQISELRRAYVSLKSYCMVRPAGSKEGKQPTMGEEDGKLIAFDEITKINTDDLDFGQLAYKIKSYGDIIPVSNELLADSDVSIMDLIGQRFVKKAINTENDKILSIIKTLAAEQYEDYKGIQTVLNKVLDPAISATAGIFTNQSGYDYLDNLVDAQKRPLLTQSLADPTQYVFKGRKIIMLKDSLLANDTTTTAGTTYAPFVIGSMADAIHFFDRAGVEVAVSTEAGFTTYATMIRAVERFDTVVADKDAMHYANIKIG